VNEMYVCESKRKTGVSWKRCPKFFK